MRIILSRKGFDSQYGGGPSPILPDGRIFSLPIPHPKGPVRFSEVTSSFGNLGHVLDQLSPKSAISSDRTHLDPDLYTESLSRHAEWRPCFGQYGSAQQHLSNQGVNKGDLFLYFGWFKRVDENFRPIPKQPDLHLIYGWLQVGEVITMGEDIAEAAQEYPAFSQHPHLTHSFGTNNTLYLAREELRIGKKDLSIAGGGVFKEIIEDRILTAEGETRSVWLLPKWFADPKPALSYHYNQEKWSRSGKGWRVRSAPKGQEFVIDTKGRDRSANTWLKKLFRDTF